MALGRKTGGRRPGSPNKVTAEAKDILLGATAELGGMARLVAWVREDKVNERIYWGQIFPKMLPLDITASEGLTINVNKRTDAGNAGS